MTLQEPVLLPLGGICIPPTLSSMAKRVLAVTDDSRQDPRPPRPGYADSKTSVLARLRRIEGQVRGLQRMVDENRYCIDILTQVNATRAALASVGLVLLRDHTEHCLGEAVRAGEGAEKACELSEAVERFVRT